MCVGANSVEEPRPQIQKGQLAKFNLRLGWSGEIWFLEDGIGRKAGSPGSETPNPLSDLYSLAYRVWEVEVMGGKGLPAPEPFCGGNFLFGTTMTQPPPPPRPALRHRYHTFGAGRRTSGPKSS